MVSCKLTLQAHLPRPMDTDAYILNANRKFWNINFRKSFMHFE